MTTEFRSIEVLVIGSYSQHEGHVCIALSTKRALIAGWGKLILASSCGNTAVSTP
jgi:hypothetical protein